MPELDGLETTRALRERKTSRRPWIVALTASAMAGDREKCLAAGMDDYLSKPLKREDLAGAMERAKRSLLGGSEGIAGTPTPRSGSTPRSGGHRRAKSGPIATPHSNQSPLETPVASQDHAGNSKRAPGSESGDELIDAFLRDGPEKLERISAAVSEGDYSKAHRLVHSLVTNAVNLGAVGMVKAGRALESALRLKSRADSQRASLALKGEFEAAARRLSRERQNVNSP